jgi:CRISPR/Cas system-associated exonuclease Cas4 (RecB family)
MAFLSFFIKTQCVLGVLTLLEQYELNIRSEFSDYITQLEERILRRQERLFVAFSERLDEVLEMQEKVVAVHTHLAMRLFPDFESVKKRVCVDGYGICYPN